MRGVIKFTACSGDALSLFPLKWSGTGIKVSEVEF